MIVFLFSSVYVPISSFAQSILKGTVSPATAGTDYAPATSGTSILKGNGAGGFGNAVSGTDYAPPSSGKSILKGNGAGGFASAAPGLDYAPATNGGAILKGNGSGGFASAAAGADYAPATSGASILKGNGTGGFVNAVSGTDYALPSSGKSILKGNGAGGFLSAAPGLDYAPATSGGAILKGNGSGGFANATAGADYAPATSGSSILKGNSAGGFSNALGGTDYVPPVDVNNHTTLKALDAANDGNLIDEIGTDSFNVVHLGGGATSAISLDSAATINQISSSAYLDFPAKNTNWTGGTENCAQKWHVYTIAATSTLTLACTGTSNQTLEYLIYQPKTGSTFGYSFAAANGAALLGAQPTTCSVNGCVDRVEVTWVPSQNDYIILQLQSNVTQASTCPTGQTCYYVAASGNDSNSGTDVSHPWLTISKAESILSTLKPGDRVLFHGGDTWTASPSNSSFILGDTSAHAVNGSASKAITIGTYGTGKAIFDEANANPYCFIAGVGGSQPPNTVQYLTLDNFECQHAYAQSVVFNASAGGLPGMTVQNFYIHNTGPGCATTTGPCRPTQEIPLDWQPGHSYAANSYTNNAIILPLNGNAGTYWFAETAGSCTSGVSAPAWNQTPGATVSDGSCLWTNTGTIGNAFLNQLHFLDYGLGVDNVHFLNNVVKWGGGHDLLEVQGDTGAALVAGNVIGPGAMHGGIDFHNTGSVATPAQVLSNVATCGWSQTLCGCQNSSTFSCSSTNTPVYYDESYAPAGPSAIIYQLNVAYDSGIAFQLCVDTSGSTAYINAKYYNNTAYVPSGAPSSYGLYAVCGPTFGSQIDVRNNIFDGAGTYSVAVGSGFTTAIEDYNDIGGAQGSPGFSFNGSSAEGSHDLTNVNPLYINATASPPNFALQSGSALINAGLAGLTNGNSNMGAY